MKLFVALVFAFCVPFYLLGFLAGDVGEQLPASALMFVCPAIAAAVLKWRKDLRVWLRSALRVPRPGRLVPAALIPPAIVVISVWPVAGVDWPALPVLAVVYLVAAAAEELGWTGYATEALLPRWGVLGAGLIIGVIWAAWHVIEGWRATGT